MGLLKLLGWSVGLAALAAGGLHLALHAASVPPAAEQPAPSAARPRAPLPGTARAAITPAAAHALAPVAAMSTAGPTLATALRDATDLRAFALDARRQPAAGGYFYAARAMAECRLRPMPAEEEAAALATSANEASEAGSAAPTHRRLQAEAAQQERWARRCASFLPQELSDAAMSSLWRQAARAGDPLAALMQRWEQTVLTDDAGGLRRVWQAIVDAGDPALLDWAAVQAGGLFGATLHEVDPAGEDTRRIDRQQVWAAVICELGAGCTLPHGPADGLCEALPRCARERWDTAAWPLAADHELATTVREVRRLLRVLKRGDAPLVGAVALASP